MANPYVQPTDPTDHQFFGGSGTSAEVASAVNGVAGGNGIPKASDIDLWLENVKNTLRVVEIPGRTDHLFVANDYLTVADIEVAAPAKIVDDISNQSMTLQGKAPFNVLITRYMPEFTY
jgi:hypothetical protein